MHVAFYRKPLKLKNSKFDGFEVRFDVLNNVFEIEIDVFNIYLQLLITFPYDVAPTNGNNETSRFRDNCFLWLVRKVAISNRCELLMIFGRY